MLTNIREKTYNVFSLKGVITEVGFSLSVFKSIYLVLGITLATSIATTFLFALLFIIFPNAGDSLQITISFVIPYLIELFIIRYLIDRFNINFFKWFENIPSIKEIISIVGFFISFPIIVTSFFNIFRNPVSVEKNISSLSITGFLGESNVLIAILGIAVIPIIFEEIIYRGIILKGMLKHYDTYNAIAFSALLFGLVHFNSIRMIYTFILGLALGYLYYKKSSLIYTMIAHFTVNSFTHLMNRYTKMPGYVDFSYKHMPIWFLGIGIILFIISVYLFNQTLDYN